MDSGGCEKVIDSNRVFIIAEAGINHNGDIEIARKMIRTAKDCGVDCVKFQTYRAEEVVSDREQTYTYKSQGKEITESMLEMFQRQEFSQGEWKEIVDCCASEAILFSSTAQNISDLEFLQTITDLPFLKVGSDDLTNVELMKQYAAYGKPMIISSGMSYGSEIEAAVRAIRSAGNSDITVLHCVSSYPAASDQINLSKIPVIRDAFGVKVGFSDHSIGSAAAVGAVCFGARVIEKHFTLSKDMAGPDHWFSIDPTELAAYVSDIRFAEKAIGSPLLNPTEKEIAMRSLCHRKAVACRPLKRGERLSIDKITFKRSGEGGIEPKNIQFILGRQLNADIPRNQQIQLKDLI